MTSFITLKNLFMSALLALMLLHGTNAEETSSVNVIKANSMSNQVKRFTAENPEFCWRDSYGRGVGTIPDGCPAGREKIGALCYSRCPAGYKRVGFDCHQICPGDMSDQGLFCRLPEYGRGGGYPWHFGDCLCNSGMIGRCERDHGRGNCEMNGAIAYPKCKPGFYAVGCCICRPNPPNCAARGLGGQFDLSCAKKIIIGDPVPMTCPFGKQMDAGLCYNSCNPTYKGVGPVCWGQAPLGMVECGMGAASDSLKCAEITADQIMAVGETALFIGSLGSSGGLVGVVKGSAKYVELATKYKKMLDAFKQVKEVTEFVQDAYDASQVVKSAVEANYAEPDPIEMVRVAAELASLVDPSGVSGIVAAYTYPICGK